MTPYNERMLDLMSNISASNWVKHAARELNRRDVIDALNDLEVLQDLMMMKFEEMKAKWELSKVD